MERILFVAGVAVITFLYGVASAQYQIFPYKLLKEAKLGLEAWAAVDRHNSHLPKAFEAFEDGAPAQPQAKRLDAGAGTEHVLVTGGPFQLMERCPRWGCMAWITDRAGKVVHAWEVDLDALWQGLEGVSGPANNLSLYPVGMALGADGSLVVSFQGRETHPVHIGIAKFDRGGRVLWKRFDRSHHWITMDGEGRVYTPFSTAVRGEKYVGATAVDIVCETGEAYVDGIRVLSAEGKMLREMPLREAFLRSGLRGQFYNLRDGCNPTHLNSVDLVSAAVAATLPGVAGGDLLVSLRETNTVALLDAHTAAVKYSVTGRTAAQHAPEFLPDGTVLVFDNLGGDRKLGGSRVVRLDLVKGTAETVFPKDGEALQPVKSQTAGDIEVSPDGRRALVSITHQGRIVEIDVASGKPLWTYDNTHDIAAFLEANDLDTSRSRARFSTYGAYYVTNLEFL